MPIWEELVVGTIDFAVLCYVLMKFVFPRMEQTFKARVDAIEGGLKRAEEAQAEARELHEQYKAQLAEARTEAAGSATKRGPTPRRSARRSPPGPARSPTGSSRPGGSRSTPSAADRPGAAGRGRRAGRDLAERIVGEALADEVRRRGTVDRFLAELDDTRWTGAGGKR